MKLTFLGTATSAGIPALACPCSVCQSMDWRDKRLRASLLIQKGDNNFLIDTGPDVRQQMLRENINHLNGILYTHEHYDHIAGIDDIKRYTRENPLPIYGNQVTINCIKRQYNYHFREKKPNASATAKLIPFIQEPFRPFRVKNLDVLPLPIHHGNLEPFGYRFDSFAYLLDCKSIPEESLKHLKNLDVLVITGLRQEEHPNHMNFREAVRYVEEIKPELTLLSHIGHETSHQDLLNRLKKMSPYKIQVAYDGLQIEIGEGSFRLTNSLWLSGRFN